MKPSISPYFALTALTIAVEMKTPTATSSNSCTGCLWTYDGGIQCFPDALKAECDAWGTDYTWCAPTGGSPTTSTNGTTAAPTTTPTSAPITAPINAPESTSFVFSPYIDIGMGTGSTLVSRMTSTGLNATTLAFATGECGSESWSGGSSSDVVALTKTLVDAEKKYIISTGGAVGLFTCANDADFVVFIEKYASDYLIGIDFDIEGSQTQEEIESLVQRVKNAQSIYPKLRFSFTVASLGQGAEGNPLNSLGDKIVTSLKTNDLTNYIINLMAMDYQSVSNNVCFVSDDKCDMGLSANQAAQNLNSYHSIPYSKIEVTVMIGGQDYPKMPTPPYVFTIGDVSTLSTFAKSKHLAGVHFWSLDRDEDCPPGDALGNCNTYGTAGKLGFTKEFLSKTR